MSEPSGATLKLSQNGIQGWAMILPVVGVPLGLHAVSGALFIGVGVAAALAPVAVPAALPLLYKVASNGGFTAITRQLFSSGQFSGSEQQVVNPAADVTGTDAVPVIKADIPACVKPVTVTNAL